MQVVAIIKRHNDKLNQKRALSEDGSSLFGGFKARTGSLGMGF
jgi:hypothetical protein